MRRALLVAIFCAFSVLRPSIFAAPAEQENLAKFKTADDLWKHLEELKRGPGRNFANREELKNYIIRIKTAALEFSTRFPSDPRRWEAKMMDAQSSAVLVQMSGARATPDQQEAVFNQIIAAPDAPRPVKTEARFGLLQLHIVPALESGKLSPELELEMAAFKKDFPSDPRITALDLMRAKLLLRSNPSKARALLGELAKNNDPSVAAEAKSLLEPPKKPAFPQAKPELR